MLVVNWLRQDMSMIPLGVWRCRHRLLSYKNISWVLLQGFDTTELNDEGKIQLVIGFFGELSVD